MLFWLTRHVELGRLQLKVACVEVPVCIVAAGTLCLAGIVSVIGFIAALAFVATIADLIAAAAEVHCVLVEQEVAEAAEAAAIVKARKRVQR